MKRMVEHGIGRLVVVEANNPRRIAGYPGRSCVFEARRCKFNSEYMIESGYRKKRAWICNRVNSSDVHTTPLRNSLKG